MTPLGRALATRQSAGAGPGMGNSAELKEGQASNSLSEDGVPAALMDSMERAQQVVKELEEDLASTRRKKQAERENFAAALKASLQDEEVIKIFFKRHNVDYDGDIGDSIEASTSALVRLHENATGNDSTGLLNYEKYGKAYVACAARIPKLTGEIAEARVAFENARAKVQAAREEAKANWLGTLQGKYMAKIIGEIKELRKDNQVLRKDNQKFRKMFAKQSKYVKEYLEKARRDRAQMNAYLRKIVENQLPGVPGEDIKTLDIGDDGSQSECTPNEDEREQSSILPSINPNPCGAMDANRVLGLGSTPVINGAPSIFSGTPTPSGITPMWAQAEAPRSRSLIGVPAGDKPAANGQSKGEKKKKAKHVYITRNGRWVAKLYHNKKMHHLGTHDTAAQAAKKYNEAALKFGMPEIDVPPPSETPPPARQLRAAKKGRKRKRGGDKDPKIKTRHYKNAYTFFLMDQEVRKRAKSSLSSADARILSQVTKKIAQMWDKLDDEAKAPYEEQSQADKKRVNEEVDKLQAARAPFNQMAEDPAGCVHATSSSRDADSAIMDVTYTDTAVPDPANAAASPAAKRPRIDSNGPSQACHRQTPENSAQ